METNVAVPQSAGTNGSDAPKVKRKRPRKWGSLPVGIFWASVLETAANNEDMDALVERSAEVSDPPVDLSLLNDDQSKEFRLRVAAKMGNVRAKILGKLPGKRDGELTADERAEFETAAQRLRNSLFGHIAKLRDANGNVPPLPKNLVPRIRGSAAGRSVSITTEERDAIAAAMAKLGF